MNNKQIIVVIIFLVSVLFFSVLKKKMSSVKQMKLIQLVQNEKYKEVEKELDSFSTKMLILPFNREFLRLNVYLLQQDEDLIKKQFDRMLSFKMSAQQKKEVLVRGFEYFLNKEDQKMSSKFLKDIKETEDEELIVHSQMMYDILLLKKTNYIDVLKGKIKSDNAMVNGMYALLISKQYGYLNDYENEKKYLDISQQYI